jgi:hypothetical protein
VKRVFDRSARTLRRRGGTMTVDWHLLSPNGELDSPAPIAVPCSAEFALPSAFASASAARDT